MSPTQPASFRAGSSWFPRVLLGEVTGLCPGTYMKDKGLTVYLGSCLGNERLRGAETNSGRQVSACVPEDQAQLLRTGALPDGDTITCDII